uniref:14-3-3 domain-containing protein n=1 Tax=Gossypium raimondii TaxID=29730 RepID=A0A0D2TUH8_GOSRA|nr:hypothetical protein B456_009G236300 [Gossypium raimondii]KJB59038.1 hypothetical protein B456_009G236300 [Gossypium raimondii]
MEKEREQQVYLARLAEQAERYDEMVEAMKSVAKLDVELTVEERNLLSVGYKNVIGARRASWRILSSIEQKEEAKGNEQNVKRIKDYRQRVEDELSKICNDILSVIDKHLIPSSSTGESTVFYYKMKGDYFRYLAEFKAGDDRKEAADQSLKAYEAATSTASSDLPPTHPIRLGLALNFSVFYYEILNSPERLEIVGIFLPPVYTQSCNLLLNFLSIGENDPKANFSFHFVVVSEILSLVTIVVVYLF